MNMLDQQQGIGLVEVLVAVLLLSVAVLGFSALQVQAISATDESLTRTKSLTLVRNLSEVMRAYPEAYVTGNSNNFLEALPSDNGARPTIQAIMESNVTDNIQVGSKTVSISDSTNSCLSVQTKNVDGKVVPKQNCSMNQLAARDALMVKKIANDEDINIAVTTCPGTTMQAIQQQMCIIMAWNETKALLSATDDEACADDLGVYKSGSDCLISEAY